MSLDRGAHFFQGSARVQLAAEGFRYLSRECLPRIQMIGVQLTMAPVSGACRAVTTAEVRPGEGLMYLSS